MNSAWLLSSAAAALALAAGGPARADSLVWHFNSDETSAYISVMAANATDEEEGDAAFSMVCTAEGDETTVVSDVDAAALGKSIAAGEVPSFHFVVDGKTDDAGDEISDIHFDQMNGIWQYVVNGVNTGSLLDAKAIAIVGAGVNLTLPTDQMSTLLHKFKDTCDTLEATSFGGEDDSGGDGGD